MNQIILKPLLYRNIVYHAFWTKIINITTVLLQIELLKFSLKY